MIDAGKVMPIPKGTYAAGTTYERLDIVTYEGSSYIAKTSTTGNLPTNTTYWQLYAQGASSNSPTYVQGAIIEPIVISA